MTTFKINSVPVSARPIGSTPDGMRNDTFSLVREKAGTSSFTYYVVERKDMLAALGLYGQKQF